MSKKLCFIYCTNQGGPFPCQCENELNDDKDEQVTDDNDESTQPDENESNNSNSNSFKNVC